MTHPFADMTARDLEQQLVEARTKVARIDTDIKANLNDSLAPRNKEHHQRLERGMEKARADMDAIREEQRRRLGEIGDGRSGKVISGEDTGGADRVRGYDTGHRAIARAAHVDDGTRHAAALAVDQDPTGTYGRQLDVTATADYLSAFQKVVADSRQGHMAFSDAERRAWQQMRTEARAATLTNQDALIPLALDPFIRLTDAGAGSAWWEQTSRTNTISSPWTGVTSAGITASWDGESSEVSDDTPTVAAKEIATHRMSAFVPASYEAMADASSFVEQMSRLLNDAATTLMGQAWTVGSGVGEPTGIITALVAASSTVAPATAETFALEDAYSTFEAVPARFRSRASWLAEVGTLNDLETFETTAGAARFPGLQSPEPMLMRRRVYEADFMDSSSDIDAAVTATNAILACVDLSEYLRVFSPGSTGVRVIDTLFGANQRPTGSGGVYLFSRVGGDLRVGSAGRVLSIPTTA